ncbi:helix-turn-helix domain-containing protein [Niallia sp. RD1]|uniref:helix-turn-helix domain-containing protein n=1 Tax=Niallia sp. RD1 TaxID=2962858 RepID=UPI0020C1A714|nr:helix-turn-helix domain-containing protein [Niallia sp. RD1]UTI41069.1 helix-turn-helix domain-containing protein [Niallia sp. RD1]
MKGFGVRIRSLRKGKGWTQEELAKRLGVTHTYVSKVESENTTPPIERLQDFAEILDVSIVDLLADKKEPPQELKDAGVKWMIVGKELEKKGITPEQALKFAEIVEMLERNVNNKDKK